MKLAIICRENHTQQTRVRSVNGKTFKTTKDVKQKRAQLLPQDVGADSGAKRRYIFCPDFPLAQLKTTVLYTLTQEEQSKAMSVDWLGGRCLRDPVSLSGGKALISRSAPAILSTKLNLGFRAL